MCTRIDAQHSSVATRFQVHAHHIYISLKFRADWGFPPVRTCAGLFQQP